MVQLSADARRLLDAANFAHLATLMPDGSPKVEPVWVGREGDRVLVTTDANSIKARNVHTDPRVAVSVTAYDDPYDQLLVRGRVVEVRADDDLAVLDGFARRYLGTAFPRRRWSGRVVLVVEPDLARAYRSALVDPRTRRRDDATDRLDIAAVLHRYADACDAKDYALLDRVFTTDAVVVYGPGFDVTGGPGPAGAVIASFLDRCGPTQHLLGNVEVAVHGDSARASCRVRALHLGTGDQAGRTWEVIGAYHDDLVRTRDGWRIQRREMTVDAELGGLGLHEA